MMIMLGLFGAGVVLEVLLFGLPVAWRIRKLLAIAAIVTVSFTAGALLVWRPTILSGLIAALCVLRAINGIRVVEGRMHERYLRHVTRRTAAACIAFQLLIAVVWVAWHRWHPDGQLAWTIVAAIQLVVTIILLASTVRRVQRTAWPAGLSHYSDAELPTITVAIPARNETEDLEACLRSLTACDYPKLEILVLDDCSQTRRTPEIIRSFAHDGVRFIQGEEPRATWLAKNQAYATLASEASGEYVLFCGVDIRFAPASLKQVVSLLLSRNKDMLSILPERAAEARSRAALAQAMRYCWELVPPRRLFRRPPILSSCWIIQKSALQRAGGFAAVARSIVPEAHFARQLTKTDQYSFMRSGRNPGIVSVKSALEQRATAVRTRYPQLHRRPENVWMLSLAEMFFLLGPFAISLTGAWWQAGMPAIVLAGTAALLLVITYEIVALNTVINIWWFGLIALIPMTGYDLALLYYSMWRYEFSEVDWKGRNICIPAMHVVPRLPQV